MMDGDARSDDITAARFVDEVIAQVRRSVGPGDDVRGARDAVAQLMSAAVGAAPPGFDPVGTLSTSPPLLAAVFQNVDLLYEAGDPRGDAIGRWVMEALARVS